MFVRVRVFSANATFSIALTALCPQLPLFAARELLDDADAKHRK
jgi:hypothetical protein